MKGQSKLPGNPAGHHVGVPETQQNFESQIQLLAAGAGLTEVLAHSTSHLTRCDLVLIGPSAEIIERHGFTFADQFTALTINALMNRGEIRSNQPVMVAQEGLLIYCLPIRLTGRMTTFLLCVTDRKLDESGSYALSQCRIGVMLARLHKSSQDRLKRQQMNSMYEGILSGSANISHITEVLGTHGIDASEGIRVIALQSNSASRHVSILTMLDDKRTLGTALVSGEANGTIFCVLSGQTQKVLTHLLSGLVGPELPGSYAGVSRPQSSLSYLKRAMFEAQIALSEAKRAKVPMSSADDTVISTVLASLHEHEIVQFLMTRYIAPLAEYDSKHETALLPTIVKYVSEGFRPGATAEGLFIHRQTLKYRLDRIARITGMNPRDPENMLEYILSVRLFDEFPDALKT